MSNRITRRTVLRAAAATTAALAFSPLVRGSDRAPLRPIRLGVVGIDETAAAWPTRLLRASADVQVAFACDPRALHDGGAARVLASSGRVDAVLVLSAPATRARAAIDLMRAGAFVGVAAPAAVSIDECHALARARRDTGSPFMLLEPSLYDAANLQVQRMADRGLFGEPTYAAAEIASSAGSGSADAALATLCRWMGIDAFARAGGDRLVSMVAMPDAGGASRVLIKTGQRRLIELRHGSASAASPAGGRWTLQGTRGAYESSRGQRMVHLAGHTPGDTWEPLARYAREFAVESSMPRPIAPAADRDAALALADFIGAVRTGRSPVDAVAAATWAAIHPLATASMAAGGRAVAVPDFSRGSRDVA